MTDEHDPDLTGQHWPDPPPDEQTAEAARLGIPFHRDLGELDLEEVRRNVVESDDPVVFVESSDVLPPPPPGEEPDETLAPPAPEGYLSGSYAQGIVQAFGEPAPLDIDEIRRRYDERAEQARHRARTRQLQDIQNVAMTILIPLIGLISAILLAGVARLVWLL